MAATPDHYDVIVIGSGPGGASLAHRLAGTGKRILMLERGGYLLRSRDNWDAKTVFVDAAYQASETWYGSDGSAFHPGLHYFVGGNSKVYGAALFRLRERDFGELRHKDGISPAWPLGYDVFEPYYMQAEALYHVHGQRGEDPTEPWSSAPYAYPPVKHEPRIQNLNDRLQREGLHPFHLPLGIKLDQNPDGRATTYSPCIRCDAFDGFPCAINAKADAQVICVDPTLAAYPNFTLLTNAYVSRLETDTAGRSVSRVHVIRDNQLEQYSADIVVAACGALSSALLLLRSLSDAHPKGLANGSDQVGRNYMRHNMSILMALLKEPNDTVFQKTLAFSDYYFGSDDWEYPLGLIQMCAKSHGEQIRGDERAVQDVLQRRRKRVRHGAQFGDHQGGAVLDDGRSQRFHRVEVVVEGTFGHPGALDDRAPIGSREPDLVEHLDRGVENLPPCRFRSNLAGHRLLPPEYRLCAELPDHGRRNNPDLAKERNRAAGRAQPITGRWSTS